MNFIQDSLNDSYSWLKNPTAQLQSFFFSISSTIFCQSEVIRLMEEILHQLIGRLSHFLQVFIPPRWCRISSINSTIELDAWKSWWYRCGDPNYGLPQKIIYLWMIYFRWNPLGVEVVLRHIDRKHRLQSGHFNHKASSHTSWLGVTLIHHLRHRLTQEVWMDVSMGIYSVFSRKQT